MKEQYEKLAKLGFLLTYIFCNTLMSSNTLKALWAENFSMLIYFKLIIAFCAMFVAASYCRKYPSFVGRVSMYGGLILTAIYTFDYYVTNISGSMFLFRVWWLIAIIMAHFGILAGIATSCDKKGFDRFFEKFAIGIAGIYFITFVICFIRAPFSGRTTNFAIFNGTFGLVPYMLKNPFGDFEVPLIVLGNIFVFTPAPFVIKGIAKKISTKAMVLIGFILPIFVEGYQYILKCGDVDVDDLILNWLGFALGLMLLKAITTVKTKKA